MIFNYLYYFHAVAHSENMSSASKHLFVSQPSLSKCISQLEKELDMPLFERRKGQIQLNEIGKLYLEYVDRAMNELEMGQKAIHDAFGEQIRRVGISQYLPIVSSELSVIAEYNKNNPGSVSLKLTDSERALEHLRTKQSQIAITPCLLHDSGIRSTPALKDEFVILVPPSHPLYREKNIDITALKEQSIICSEFNSDMYELLCKLCTDRGFAPRIAFQSPGNTGFTSSVSRGSSILLTPLLSLLSKRDTQDRPQDKEFETTRILRFADPECRITVYLSRPSGEYPHASVDTFYAEIQEFIKDLNADTAFAIDFIEADNRLAALHKAIDIRRAAAEN